MAKTINRIGIIFLALVVSLLVAVGSVFAVSVICDDLGVKNLQENNAIVANTPPTVSEGNTITLSGDSMNTDFTNACKLSAEKNTTIKVVLDNDWTTKNGLNIPFYATILLDLNGYTINRNLTGGNSVSAGSVFYVYGHLMLTDSVYLQNAEAIKAQVETIYDNKESKTEEQIAEELMAIDCGKITGGYTSGYGGGINVKGLPDNTSGLFQMYGGMICNNLCNSTNSNRTGGGVFIYEEGSAYFYDGIIAGNKSLNTKGGGVVNLGHVTFANGLIIGNTANSYGGGIASSGNMDISNITIRDNSAVSGGGGIYSNNSLVANNVVVKNNSSNNYGGGIAVSGYALLNKVTVENSIGRYAAGIYCFSNGYVEITESIVRKNTANLHAGGIYTTDTSILRIKNTIIEENVANCTTGSEVGVAGLHANYSSTVYASDLTVRNNYANENIGGSGITVAMTSRLFLRGNNTIVDNRLNSGKSDLYLSTNKKLEIDGTLNINNLENPIIVALPAEYDKFMCFTDGYTRFGNGNVDPAKLFTLKDSNAVAKLKNGEVVFDYYEDSKYDFVYLENGVRKNYKDNEKLFGYNDSAITYKVLGKIAPETTINTFVDELKFDNTKLQIFNNDILVYDKGSKLVDGVIGSGWKIVYDGAEIYLSVLGDVTGDGRIDATDITYLRRIANGEIDKATLNPAILLSAMVDNRGGVTSVDAEILRAICKYETTIDRYY